MEGQQRMTLSGVVVSRKTTDKVGGSLFGEGIDLVAEKLPLTPLIGSIAIFYIGIWDGGTALHYVTHLIDYKQIVTEAGA